MTDGRKPGTIGETCKKYLNEIYISKVYNRTNEISSKFMEKGTLVEEDSMSLLSETRNKLYLKYKGAPLKNELICGTPDIKSGIDIKSSWNIHTFFNAELTKANEWQAHGYMMLTGLQEWEIVYVLVSAPKHLIEREERSLFYKMGVESEEDPTYQMAKAELHRNMVFDDITKEKRVKTFIVKHDQEKINALENRILECRELLNEMYKSKK
jgi:hypothetical protein